LYNNQSAERGVQSSVLDYPEVIPLATGGRASIHHSPYPSCSSAKLPVLHRRHRHLFRKYSRQSYARVLYNGGFRLRAMRLWRFSGRIEMFTSPQTAMLSHEVVEKVLLNTLQIP